MLCGDNDETNNNVINEYSKLAQREYKTIHEWVGMVIHWELCKIFIFDSTTKWCMSNPKSIQENEMLKFIWDFELQMDHLKPKKSKKRDKYLDLGKER